MITKEQFVEVLKRNGYSASLESGKVDVEIVTDAGDHETVKKIFKEIKLLANKYGYKHSFGVKRMVQIGGSNESNKGSGKEN